MPSALDSISRRHLLVGGGLLAVLTAAAAACGSAPTPPAVDELEAQQRLARGDSELAAAAAAALTGADRTRFGPALDQVAAERAEHATVLATEIARAAGKPEPTASETAEAAPTAPTDQPGPTVADVVGALRTAADSAGQLAVASSGYRAGLLASIAAACTAAYAVALAPPQ